MSAFLRFSALATWLGAYVSPLLARNIRVNVLSPGPIQTPGFDVFANPDVKKSLVPLGRTGRRNRQSRIILASDDSSFVNGLELSVDGGFSAI